jgi:transcription elongation GreA/GreB family factor
MDAELEKLVESGKLTSKAAEKLEELKPGTFCLHKSWGFGRVAEWNLLLNQIVIDFAGKKRHPMQLQYAAENVTAIPASHFLARKATDIAAVTRQAKEDAVGVVRNIVESFGGKATVQQISEWLIGDVFDEPGWKRWWESAKKLLKKDGHFFIPTKKNEPIQLRSAPVSHADELLVLFSRARQPRDQAAALDQIIKLHNEFREPEKQLQPVIAAIEQTAMRNQKLHPALSFELVLGRDDLLERIPQLRTTIVGFTSGKLITEEAPRLVSILPKMPAAKERRVLQALPAALGPNWVATALRLMQGSQLRMIGQIARVMVEAGHGADLHAAIDRSIREHSATSEMLVWLCKERQTEWRQLITPELLTAILAAMERDQHRESRSSKLRDLLIEDRDLIADMFGGADISTARDAVRRLLLTPVLDELTKRSLLARIVKLYPELESMISGAQGEEKTAPVVVSWSSLEKRRAEYEELVKQKIPENSKEIALARSYGDLSENFEFKAAKQMQAVLMRRKGELERMLHNARGTSFEDADTSRVSIGTIVTLQRPDSGLAETYTILGAWDGDPERHVISYQTAIGQALLGRKAGETVLLNREEGATEFEIISIEPAPVDVAPASSPDLVETAVSGGE